MMQLFWCPNTRAVRVVWMLEELSLEYELVNIDIRDTSRPRPDAFAEASPMGKVPALADGAVRMAESSAICLYLADRYGDGVLAPAIDDSRRGAFLYWLMYAPAVIEPAMAERFGNHATSRVSHGWGDFDTMIAVLAGHVATHRWALGEQFSAADVMLGSSANFMKMFGILPDSAPIEAYIERCLERPAYQKALAINAAGGAP